MARMGVVVRRVLFDPNTLHKLFETPVAPRTSDEIIQSVFATWG